MCEGGDDKTRVHGKICMASAPAFGSSFRLLSSRETYCLFPPSRPYVIISSLSPGHVALTWEVPSAGDLLHVQEVLTDSGLFVYFARSGGLWLLQCGSNHLSTYVLVPICLLLVLCRLTVLRALIPWSQQSKLVRICYRDLKKAHAQYKGLQPIFQ